MEKIPESLRKAINIFIDELYKHDMHTRVTILTSLIVGEFIDKNDKIKNHLILYVSARMKWMFKAHKQLIKNSKKEVEELLHSLTISNKKIK